MRKKMVVYILVVCLAAAIFSGCSQAAPASAQISGAAASMSADSGVTPTGAPSQSEQSAQSVSFEADSSPAPSPSESAAKYQVEVAYDMETEENTQKSVDEGHSPWRLDPAYVAQVFVSLMISPEGITGDYPIPYEDFKLLESSAAESVVEVNNDKSPASRVYLERLVRQEEGGIWTVVGYDPAS